MVRCALFVMCVLFDTCCLLRIRRWLIVVCCLLSGMWLLFVLRSSSFAVRGSLFVVVLLFVVVC